MSVIALARAPFPRYWLSAFLADFGDGIRFAAFPLLTAQLTKSPAAVAAVTAVQGLPWVIGLSAGALVDRRDLRAIMVGVDVIRVALVAALAVGVVTNIINLPLIYLTAFVTGVGSMVRDTAAGTAVPRLIDHDELERANGHLVAGGIVGTELAGPAVGGWLFGVATALPFALNAGSLGIAILLLLTLPSVFSPIRRSPGSAGAARTAIGDIREGLSWLWRDRSIRNLVIAVGLVAVADGAYLAVLVLYVTQVLQRSSAVYGLLLAFGALGGIAAGAACGRLTRWFGSRRLLSGTVIVMAAAQLVLALTSDVFVAAATLACSSGAFAAFNATSRSMRQRRTPPHLLGRINSTYLTAGRGAAAMGALAGGALAAVAGIQAPILAGVVPLLGAATLIARGHRAVP